MKYPNCETDDIVLQGILRATAGMIEIGPGYNCLEVRNLNPDGESHQIPGYKAEIEFRAHRNCLGGAGQMPSTRQLRYSIHIIGKEAEKVFADEIGKLVKAGWSCFDVEKDTQVYAKKYS